MSVRLGTAQSRRVLLATVLGSGIAFLDSTVVNVALPHIADDFDAGIDGLQWTIDAYLVTLTALLLLGGSVGDRYGRRRAFVGGLVAFTAASVACAVAPSVTLLNVARAAQGVGAAFLVPGSLAIIGATFHEDDRGRAIGAWSGLSGVSTAIGPFVGGWLIDAVSWRFVFLVNVPLAAVAVWVSLRHVPETRAARQAVPDYAGAALVSVALAALCWGLIERRTVSVAAGLLAFGAFLAVQARSEHPMLPLRLFRAGQFAGANATTLAVYAALGGMMFVLVLQLQFALGYSALEAGAALLPVTLLMLLLSSRAGALAQRIGPRLPMTLGPLVVACGLLLFTRVGPGESYAATVFPAAVVFGLGLALTVAPLTATVMAAVPSDDLGIASGVNNAVARLAGLLAVAVLPALVGFETGGTADEISAAAHDAMVVCAALAAAGGAIAFFTIRSAEETRPTVNADMQHPCTAGMRR